MEMFTSVLTLSLLQGITTFALNSVVHLWNAKVIVQCRKGGMGGGGGCLQLNHQKNGDVHQHVDFELAAGYILPSLL